jgi:hypothetical protein
MSGCVGLQSADLPAAAWLSAVLVGLLFLEGCAIWDEPDSETSAHPASTKTNKDAASMHPNHILFSRATKVAPSLTVTVCVSYGNQRTTHRDPSLPTDRTLDRACLGLVLTPVSVQADLSRCLMCKVPGPSTVRSSATRAFKAALSSYGYLVRDRQRNRRFFSGMLRGVSTFREGSKILTFPCRPRLVCISYISEAWGRCILRTTSPCAPSPKFCIVLVLCGRVSCTVSAIRSSAYIHSLRS